MRVVTLEEHISLPEFDARISKEVRIKRGWPDPDGDNSPMKRVEQLLGDVSGERLRSMDKTGITTQVLSVTAPGSELLPPDEAVPFSREYNDEIKKLIDAHPGRFAAFAVLPVASPEAAAEELERAVKELGFVGTMINGTTDDLFLDDARFAPILAKAEELDVPVYIHPNLPPKAVNDIYYSNLPDPLGFTLSIAGWGWHSETAVHLMRMILSGTFEKYPKLKIIIGHMGEMLPMMLDRIDKIYKRAGLPRSVSEVIKSNVWITTSGLFTQPPLQLAIDTLGVDRILFSIDYPYSPNEAGQQFLSDMKLSSEDKEKIAHRNADALLKLKV